MNKKNQHYVPQFYLRNFSNNRDGKTIGLFNLANELYVSSTLIKNQSSKDYFYGKDGKLESGLSQIESTIAPKIAEISKTGKLPRTFSDNHIALLTFLILSDFRNPIHLHKLKDSTKLINEEVKSEEFMPEIDREYALKLAFSSYEHMLKICLDLDIKLLINNTSNPLFTCDFPVVKYNQFLENKNMHGSNTGYAAVGLQIFMPINSEKCLLFYDPKIYKVGNRRDKSILLTKEDVNQINTLQVLNCWQNIYFDNKAEKAYVKKIYERSTKFKKANELKASSLEVVRENEVQKNEQVIHVSVSDLKTNLKISKIKLTRRANNINLNNKVSPMRDKAKLIIGK